MGRIIVCEYCRYNKKVKKWNARKKAYEYITCPACKGNGAENTGNW